MNMNRAIWDPFLLTWFKFNLIPTWISGHMVNKVWDGIGVGEYTDLYPGVSI